MARFLRRRDAADGQGPESLVFLGTRKVENPSIHIMTYNKKVLREIGPSESIPASISKKDKRNHLVRWVNVYGVHDRELISTIGTTYAIHPLVLEDIMNTGQRPKIEEFDDMVVITLKMMRYDAKEDLLHSEQLTLLFGKQYVITFQERPGDIFASVRDRLRRGKGKMRSLGADYLAYALLDTVADDYISIVERLGGKVEDLDDDVLSAPNPETHQRINALRREINYLHKSIRPAREALLRLTRSDSRLVSAPVRPYMKDVLDLCGQANEAVDAYRDMTSDQLNNYNSAVNERMNEIMRVLTIFAAIFIPLTFIAGVYGMNFDNIPELHYRYGYFIVWSIMILMGGTMVAYFKKKNWL